MSSGALGTLWAQFRRASIRNIDAKDFIPDSKLVQILKQADSNLEQCLMEANIDPLEYEEILSVIRNGGQKVFTILVLMQGHPVKLILNFMRGDQMLQSVLDAKLPFSIEELEDILKDDLLASDFDERQWKVLSPLFRFDRTHRELKHQTILPFIDVKKLKNGEGGCGTVTKVTLHADHHRFRQDFSVVSAVEIARKQIKIDDPDTDADTYENERRIMRLLQLGRHENMMKLLASYSVLGLNDISDHFLLMPLADMRLTDLLKVSDKGDSPSLDDIFGTEINLLHEIHGLSSALEDLHFYESADEKLHLKGYHFDLDPRNILIQDGKLLLADFGLSKMKNESSDSCTPFHGGGASHYTAPECTTGDHQYHGRKSDMWSFGGILCDLLACMMQGVPFLEQFQRDRKRTVMGITSSRFHIGGEPHPVVEKWMIMHHQEMSLSHQALCSVSKNMLNIDPTHRPDSHMVTRQLFMIAAQAQTRSILDRIIHLEGRSKALRLRLERIKLGIWASHARISDPSSSLLSDEQCWLFQESSRSHKVIKSLLQEASVEVGLLESEKDLSRPGLSVFRMLQDIFERLWKLTPRDVRDIMARETELNFLNLTDMNPEEDLPSSTTGVGEAKLLQLAAIRKFTHYVRDAEDTVDDEGAASNDFGVTRFEEKEIQIIKSEAKNNRKKETLRDWSLISLGDQAVWFLCEWVYYDAKMMDVEPQRLHRRVCSIVYELSIVTSRNDPENNLKALHCAGYFVSSMNSAFGILFRLPTSRDIRAEPVSLNQILRCSSRPSLTEVFKLAKAVARSIFSFHGITWVHKNISSHTVVFVDEYLSSKIASMETLASEQHAIKICGDESQAKPAKKSPWWILGQPKASTTSEALDSKSRSLPAQQDFHDLRKQDQFKLNSIGSHYIVGFNHSRADNTFTFTRGEEGLSYEYQHYKYASQSGKPFQSGYDYYSLGLVLLELGLWTPLDKLPILDQELVDMPLDAIQNLMSEEAVPLLGPIVGEEYQEAVRICLSEELLDIERSKVEEIFSKQVLGRLEKCHV